MKINFRRILLGFFENWDKSPQKKWDSRDFASCVRSLKSGIIRTELMSGVFQNDVKHALSASVGADIVSWTPPPFLY